MDRRRFRDGHGRRLSTAADAQHPRPLSPAAGRRATGSRPSSMAGTQNPDGTISLSFGYSNLNKDDVEIPLGPDNFIMPKEYDGRQPTTFLVMGPDLADASGGGAAGASRRVRRPRPRRGPGAGGGVEGRERDRERGVFTVTVPKGLKGDVVWTLRHAGQTFAIPGRSKSTAYQLSWPAAMGVGAPVGAGAQEL